MLLRRFTNIKGHLCQRAMVFSNDSMRLQAVLHQTIHYGNLFL
jgi:hypothetical protein